MKTTSEQTGRAMSPDAGTEAEKVKPVSRAKVARRSQQPESAGMPRVPAAMSSTRAAETAGMLQRAMGNQFVGRMHGVSRSQGARECDCGGGCPQCAGEIQPVTSSGMQTGGMPSADKLIGTLNGDYVLEVAIQDAPVPNEILAAAKAKGVIIRDVAGTIYELAPAKK